MNRRKNRDINIAIEELCGYKTDLAARLLAWNVCVDMIAQAIGRCEFRTYLNHDVTTCGTSIRTRIKALRHFYTS